MIDALISSKTRIKLLLKFFLNSHATAYLRSLESEFGESTNGIRLELNRLEGAGLLVSESEGNKKIFRANTSHPLFREIHNIILKHIGLDQIVENVIQRLGDVQHVYLVGDFSKGMDSQVIDLILIGDFDKTYLAALVEKAEKLVGRKIRYLLYSNLEAETIDWTKFDPTPLLLWSNLDQKTRITMYEALIKKDKSIAVIGLGYVGLPLALAFAKKFRVIGFDVNPVRVEMMRRCEDPSREMSAKDFDGADIHFTSEPEELKAAHFFVISVPTDIDEHKVPDLSPLKSASASVGNALKPGDYVVYESTVYPGCTEEDCLPILEELSGLTMGADFKIGYSPERINPGDKTRPLTKILKIVSGCDEEALENIARTYEHIIEAGVYKASSIKVAEAAKVIENTQRDLNISLMNELAIIFDRMGIDTHEVIKAAGTKWNFLKFYPGLVGGHCIGVDPYYLLHKSVELGYEPQVILSGRRVNDGMPAWIAKRLVQLLIQRDKNPRQSKVLVLGITFKENVADIRNSKVAALVRELQDFSVNVHVVDPYASPNEVAHEYKLTLADKISEGYDAVIVAVAHRQFLEFDSKFFLSICREKPILMDLKGIYHSVDEGIEYWRL